VEVSPTRLGSRLAGLAGETGLELRRSRLENSQAGHYGAIGQMRRPFDMLVAISLILQSEFGLEDFHELLHAVLLRTKLLEGSQNLAQLG
jgi:hypothetical protein